MSRAIVSWMLIAAGGSVASATDETELFRKPIEAARAIVVVRGPTRDTRLVEGFAGDVLKNSVGVYTVSVEIRADGQPPLVLWSMVRFEREDPGLGAFDVLDIDVHAREIVLATAEGCSVRLTRIHLNSRSVERVSLRQADWSLDGEIRPLDRRSVAAKLARTDDGRLTVRVDHTRVKSPDCYGTFEQIDGDWMFKLVEGAGIQVRRYKRR